MSGPGFFILGHSKSGTTALATFLSQHPDLYVCEPVEPNYFCPSWWVPPGIDSAFLSRTESEYLSLFDGARPGQVCGEASASYLYSPESAQLIHDFDPRAKLIMIFREPSSFLRSYHLQLLRNAAPEGETVKQLSRAIDLEDERRRGRCLPSGCLIPEMLYYLNERLQYETHYDRYARLFDPSQILALTYDEFRADNRGTVRRVLSFLDVDPTFEPALEDHNVGGARLRSRTLQRMTRRATHGGGPIRVLRRAIPAGVRRRTIEAAYDRVIFAQPEGEDAALTLRIRRRAYPHVAALGERLNRNLLEEWDYDRAAVG